MLFLTIIGLWLLCSFFNLIICALELIKLSRKHEVNSIEELYKEHPDDIIGSDLKETITIHIVFGPILLIAYVGFYTFTLLYDFLFNKLWRYVTEGIYKFIGYFIEKYGVKKK